MTKFPIRLVALAFGILFLGVSFGQVQHQQHATLGVLVDLHEAVGEVIGSKGPSRILCGSLNVRAYQQLAAVRWAAEIINNNSWSNEFSLDIVVHDTCGESGIALSETHQLLNWSKENVDEAPLIGVMVIGSRNNERIIDKPLEILNKENISAVVTSSRAAELLLTKHLNVFTTAPGISSVIEAVVALIHQLGTSSVAVISSCSHAIRQFQHLALAKSIPANYYSVLQKDNPLILEAVIKFLQNEASSAQTVVLLLEGSDLERLLRSQKQGPEFKKLVARKSWILGSVGMDQGLGKEWTEVFGSNLLFVQPHISPNPDFQAYFLESIGEALIEDTMDEAREYIEKIYRCQWPETSEMSQGMRMKSRAVSPSCGNLSSTDLSGKFHPDSDVGFIVSAVSAYSAALRLAQLETCGDEADCDTRQLSVGVIDALRKLNFPIEATTAGSTTDDPTEPTVAASHELEGTRGRINHQGKLVSRKYDLFLSRPGQDMERVGQYSSENGLTLDSSFDLSLGATEVPEKDFLSDANSLDVDTTIASPTNPPPSQRRGKKSKVTSNRGTGTLEFYHQLESQVHVTRMTPELYISRVWAMVVVAVGITGVFLALYMLVYVLLRMCDGTLGGNQVFGILLLLCVMLLYSTVVLFVLPPSPLLCNLRVFLPSTALALSFGILLLKAMQLRSLVSLGLGGRVSSFNQFVTLIFIVAVQMAVNLQWLLGPKAEAPLNPRFLNDCAHSHQTFLLLHSYLGLLILFVFLYGTSVLKIRRNYNEARWVTLAALLSLPVAIGWVLVVFIGPPEFQEPAASVTYLSIATVLLFSIFIPKLGTIGRQTSLAKRKQMLQHAGPGHTGSISTIFTTLSDRGHHHGTLQGTQKLQPGSRASGRSQATPYSIPPPPPFPASGGKSVTYSPRLSTNIFHIPSPATSLARTSLGRNGSMKTPLFEPSRGAYP